MSRLLINPDAIVHNYNILNELFKKNKIDWSVATKVLSGYKPLIELLGNMGVRRFSDSRLANLRLIRYLYPHSKTIYIRPADPANADDVVRLADISLNTELGAIIKLSEAAQRQKKKHEVIIMVELGELREGVMPGGMMELYLQASRLQNITVAGFGTYFSKVEDLDYIYRKLDQLIRCKRTIEEKFNTRFHLCSAGTSVVLPNLIKNRLPEGINHFRVGESLFLGTNLVSEGTIEGFMSNGFRLAASILELKDKPAAFTGEIPEDCEGGYNGKKAVRAVLDVGRLDVPVDHLRPVDANIKILSAATDLLVVDLSSTGNGYALGEEIEFQLDYQALLSLMHSRYVKKEMIHN